MARKFVLSAQLRLQAPSSSNLTSVVRTINAALGSINTNINVRFTPGTQKQLQALNKSLNTVSRNANAAHTDLEKFGRNAALAMKRFAAFTIATAGFVAFTQAIRSSFKEAVDFDREMVRLSQVTGFAVKDLKNISGEITRLSTGLGVSSKKLINVSVTLAQAGLSAKDTSKALETLAKTELSSTFSDITETTEGAIAIMAQFGTTVNDLERDLSAVNAVSAKFAVESSDLVTAVRRTGGAFKAAGGNLNELLALFTSVRATTRESAESIATGFRTIFTRLQRVRTQNFLGNLGVQLRDLEGQFVGPFEAIRRLSTALKNIPSTDPRFSAIIEELGGFRQISKVIPLIQQFAVSQSALNVAIRSNSSLSEDAAKAQGALAVQLAKVGEEFNALIRKISENEGIRAFINLTLRLSSALIKVVDSITPLIPLIGAFGAVGLGKAATKFGRGYISGFASGGMVPGSGSGDTVPALLTPGEFVLNKKATRNIGPKALGSLNKYAKGDVVTSGKGLNKKQVDELYTNLFTGKKSKGDIVAGLGAVGITGINANKLAKRTFLSSGQLASALGVGEASSAEEKKGRIYADVKKPFGAIFLDAKSGLGRGPITIKVSRLQQKQQQVAADQIKNTLKLSPEELDKTYVRANPVVNVVKKNIASSFSEQFASGLKSFIDSLVSGTGLSVIGPPSSQVKLGDILETGTIGGIKGSIFEGYLNRALTYTNQRESAHQNFDIPAGAKTFNSDLIFNRKLSDKIPHEIKVGDDATNIIKLISKGVREFGVQRRASGGPIGGSGSGDTVPALLTPGEFVINKRSAQAIGMTKLRQLNKFARGGSVGSGSIAAAAVGTSLLSGLDSGGPFGQITGVMTALISSLFIFKTAIEQSSSVVKANTKIEEIRSKIQTKLSTNEIKLEKLKRQEAKLSGFIGPLSPAQSSQLTRVRGRISGLGASNTSLNSSLARTNDIEAGINKRVLGAAVGGAIVGIVGDSISSYAQTQAQEGKNVSSLAGIGGALSTGTQFAAIGALAGPIGAAVGGVLGLGIGGYKGFTGAESKFNEIKFAKSVDKLSTVINNVNLGRGSVFGSVGGISAGLVEQRNALAGLTGEGKETATARIVNELGSIEQFVIKLAEGSKTTQEFDIQSRELINHLAIFSDITIADATKQFHALIEAKNKEVKLTQEMVAQQSRNIERTREFTEIIFGFKNATRELLKFSNSVSIIEGAINNSLGAFVTEGAGDIFKGTGVGNTGIMQNEINRLLKPLGDGLKEFGQEAIQVAQLSSKLPNILLSLQDSPLLEGAESSFNDKLVNAISKALPNVSNFILDSVTSQATRVIGGDAKDERIIRMLAENLPGVAKELLEGLDDYNNILDEVNQITTNFNNKLASVYSLRTQLELKNVDSVNKASSIREQAAQKAAELTEGGRFTTTQGESFRKQRLGNLLGGFSGSPSSIGKSITNSRSLLQNIDEALGNASTGSNTQKSLLKAREKEVYTITTLTKALETMADATEQVANIERDLAREQNSRRAKFDLAKEFTFGDNSSRRDLGRNLLGARVLGSTSNINTIPDSLRGGALSVLERFGDTKLDVFGGREGKDVIRDVIANQLRQLGVSEKDITSISNATPKEQQLLTEISNAFKVAEQAQLALTNNITSGNKELLTGIDKLNKDFIRDLRDVTLNASLNSLRNKETGLLAESSTIIKTLDNLKKLGGLTGIDIKSTDDIGKVTNLLSSIKDYQSIFGKFVAASDFKLDSVVEKGRVKAGVFNVNDGPLSKIFSPKEIFNLQQKVISEGQPGYNTALAINNKKAELRTQLNDLKLGALNNVDIVSFVNNAKSITDTITGLQELKNVSGNIDSLKLKLSELVEAIDNAQILRMQQEGKVQGKAFGGIMRPRGTDTVPAMLTPGEYVIRKSAVDAVGTEFLDSINYRAGGGFIYKTGGKKINVPYTGEPGYYDRFKKSDFKDRVYRGIDARGEEGFINTEQKILEQIEDKGVDRAARNKAIEDAIKRKYKNPLEGFRGRFIRNKVRPGFGMPGMLSPGENIGPIINAKEKSVAKTATSIKKPVANKFPGLLPLSVTRTREDSINQVIKDSLKATGGNRDAAARMARLARIGSRTAMPTNKGYTQFGIPGAGGPPIRFSRPPGELAFQTQQTIDRAINNREPGTLSAQTQAVIARAKARRAGGGTQTGPGAGKRARARAGYAGGGLVGYYAGGGQVGGGATGFEGIDKLENSINRFSSSASQLSSSLDSFPREISLAARHTVEVIFNGAQILTSLLPSIQEIAIAESSKAINKMIREKMPSVGRA